MSGPHITISTPQPFQTPSARSCPSAVLPMAVSRAPPSAQPPLPPPPFLPDLAAGHHDPGWQWGNDPNGAVFGKPTVVKPGSNLLGGASSMRAMRRHEKEHDHLPAYKNVMEFTRRGSLIATATTTAASAEMGDMESVTPSEEDSSQARPPCNYRLQGERQLEQRTLEASSNTYDKHLLSRIGGPNGPPTPKRMSLSYCGSVQETAQLAHAESERRNSQLLRPLSMPERQQSSLDSPASSRWSSSGAVSPGSTGFWSEHTSAENCRTQLHPSQTRHNSLTFDDPASQSGSHDHSMYNQGDFLDDSPMGSLDIHDRFDRSPGPDGQTRTSSKRRASSPPRDGSRDDRSFIVNAPGHTEPYHRRSVQQLPRASPVSRFHPNHSSVSSASSYGPPSGSASSSLGISSIPSSATSYGSGRISPSALSSVLDPELRMNASYSCTKALSPNSAASSTPHHRSLSESTQGGSGQPKSPAGSLPHSRNGSVSQVQGAYICECCPKKPKKFGTEEELRLHESEKQYTCAYCPNRFKNKNEAERHQNSLHLRRHSWSCAVLAGVKAAYHSSLSGNGRDVCGYCGEEFPNPPQWDMRAEHLSHVHKFGECNQAKKFFRADHFRQHLKHSHQGTSGKWTNMLEIACMKDEPLPEKRVAAQGGGQAPPPALMETTTGLSSSHPAGGAAPGETN